MRPREPSHLTTSSPKYYKQLKNKKTTLKLHFIKKIEVLKEEMNKALKEIIEKTVKHQPRINTSLEECQESQKSKQTNNPQKTIKRNK